MHQNRPDEIAKILLKPAVPLPKFTLPRRDGSPLVWKTLGKPRGVLLSFWATWCPPCVEEWPLLLKMLRESQGQLKLIAISSDSSWQEVDDFLGKMGLEKELKELNESVVILLDKDGAVSREVFNILRLPEVFIADKNLYLRAKTSNIEFWKDRRWEELRHILDLPLGGAY